MFVYLLSQLQILHQVLLTLSQLKYSLQRGRVLEINLCFLNTLQKSGVWVFFLINFSPAEISLTSCRFISFGLRGCVAPSRTSNVSLQSLLSRRLAAGAVAVETRVAVTDEEEEGLETVAEITRVFIVEEERGGWAALSI